MPKRPSYLCVTAVLAASPIAVAGVSAQSLALSHELKLNPIAVPAPQVTPVCRLGWPGVVLGCDRKTTAVARVERAEMMELVNASSDVKTGALPVLPLVAPPDQALVGAPGADRLDSPAPRVAAPASYSYELPYLSPAAAGRQSSLERATAAAARTADFMLRLGSSYRVRTPDGGWEKYSIKPVRSDEPAYYSGAYRSRPVVGVGLMVPLD
jgi:hypothetical protein